MEPTHVQTTRFALTQLCESNRVVFQAQLGFFSFFAAANGVAGGWLVDQGFSDGQFDDDQGMFSFFFIVANAICAISFAFRAGELTHIRSTYHRLLKTISEPARLDDLQASFPFAIYERTSILLAVGCLVLLGLWVFALAEALGNNRLWSLVYGALASSLFVAICAAYVVWYRKRHQTEHATDGEATVSS